MTYPADPLLDVFAGDPMQSNTSSILDLLYKAGEAFLPIALLLVVVALVVMRLPSQKLGHSSAFLRRRVANWLPLGLTYALLYMGRYNLTVSKNALGDLMTKADFGTIFFWGTLTYGCAFVINGPLTDALGGKRAMLLATSGSAVANGLLGFVTYLLVSSDSGIGVELLSSRRVLTYSILYAVNMYFQSFGAVSIVKVNAHWFHLKERGVFGGVFGILISLGIYFAFDLGQMIVDHADLWWVFYTPAVLLTCAFGVNRIMVKDSPVAAGFPDLDTADASSSDDGQVLSALTIAKKMLNNPVILTIALVEFCSGFLRNAIMHWYIVFAKETGIMGSFVAKHWGMMLCMAGILGGVLAGTISDRLFQSRRGPVSAVLYFLMVAGSAACFFALDSVMLGWIVVGMSMCIIGVHGMLSGTASMDFGGRKNVGVAVGMIDGFVYLGTAFQSLVLGYILPSGPLAKDALAWKVWPMAMLPMAILGFFLAMRIWNAKPEAKSRPNQLDGFAEDAVKAA